MDAADVLIIGRGIASLSIAYQPASYVRTPLAITRFAGKTREETTAF